MAKKKSGFLASMDGLSWIVKLILFIPPLAIIWLVYRIILVIDSFSLSRLIGLLLWFIALGWIIDLISTILNKKIAWFV